MLYSTVYKSLYCWSITSLFLYSAYIESTAAKSASYLSFENYIEKFSSDYNDCNVSLNSSSCLNRRSLYSTELNRIKDLNDNSQLWKEGKIVFDHE